MTTLEGDLRIEKRERELARLQAGARGRKVELNLVRGALKQTLTSAAVFARGIAAFAESFGQGVEQVSNDLAGKEKKKP